MTTLDGAAAPPFEGKDPRAMNVSTDDQWYPTDPRDTPGTLNPFFHVPGSGQHTDQERWFALRTQARRK